MGHYLVRAMAQNQEDFDVFFTNEVVAVGWSNINFTKFESAEELVKKVDEECYQNSDTAPQVAGRKKNEVRQFKNLNKNDKIIIPVDNAIALAYAKDEEIYDGSLKNTLDLSNQRKVNYLRDEDKELIYIPRSQLTEGLQRRLRVRGTTIADLEEFSTEIDRLFKGESFDPYYTRELNNRTNQFKRELLKHIQSGQTYLKSGGIGLELLVKELLEIEGYEASRSAKNKFKGFADVDIVASRSDHIHTIELYVQVKHHSGTSETWGAKQLLYFLEQESDFLSEYQLVLITSGKASETLIELCEDKGIILIQGEDLANWIFERLSQLSFKTKRHLSLLDIPEFLN